MVAFFHTKPLQLLLMLLLLLMLRRALSIAVFLTLLLLLLQFSLLLQLLYCKMVSGAALHPLDTFGLWSPCSWVISDVISDSDGALVAVDALACQPAEFAPDTCSGDEALERIGCREQGSKCTATTTKRNCERARLARAAIHRYKQRQDPVQQQPAELIPIFNRYRNHDKFYTPMTVADITRLVFYRHAGQSLRREAADQERTRSFLQRVRVATLFRFVYHRSLAWQRTLASMAPAMHLVVSVCFKWDETQQRLQHKAVTCPRSQGHNHKMQVHRMTHTEHVFVASAHCKTRSMPAPALWNHPPLLLQRTTAECLWLALRESTPCGPWQLLDTEVARWVLYVFCADEGSSNKKLFKQAVALIEALQNAQNTLMHFSACLLHVLHRSVIPTLQFHNFINNLYRAANVMRVSTYWLAMVESTMRVIDQKLLVLHYNAEPQIEAHRKVATHILHLCLEGSAVECMQTFLELFSGDWTCDTITFHCKIACCVGGGICRRHAVETVQLAARKLLFSRGVQIPALNRWWKYAPMARQVLLGCALHSLWILAVPAKMSRNQIDAPVLCEDALPEDSWHAVHNARVKLTWEFFQAPNLVCDLVVQLQSLEPRWRLMAWLMKHFGRDNETHKLRDKVSTMLKYIDPKQSPVFVALAESAALLTSQEHWRAAFAYNAGSAVTTVILNIWRNLLPGVAVLSLRPAADLEGWPLRLLRMLLWEWRQSVSVEFARAKTCCLAATWHRLHACVRDKLELCLADWFLQLIHEFASQLDFVNYDCELDHAAMRAALAVANGKSYSHGYAALMHMAASISSRHAAEAPEPGERLARQTSCMSQKAAPLRWVECLCCPRATARGHANCHP